MIIVIFMDDAYHRSGQGIFKGGVRTMRVSQDEKDRSHRRIVEAAARLLRERGVESTGVADVMAAAGLTHGGFYRHFEGKDAMLGAALEEAFNQILFELDTPPPDQSPGATVAAFEAKYLSEGHVGSAGIGCPVAALAADVARASLPLRAAFTVGVKRMIASLARGMKGTEGKRRDQAIRRLAMMAGAVMIARATDQETAKATLAACRTN